MYQDIIDYEMEVLKETVSNGGLSHEKSNNFIRDYDWEDEFSHNEISKIQQEFIIQAKEYLSSRFKNKYIIYSDWCVHICDIDFFNKELKGFSGRYEIC